MRFFGAAVALLSFAGHGAESINFDRLRPGVVPPGWTMERARWQVRHDPTAPSRPNVLELLSASNVESDSPLAVFNPVVCRDGEVTVKFKIEAGEARTAGIVWRYKDPRNYYLLDFSADRRSISLYRIQDGLFQSIRPLGASNGDSSVTHDIRTGQWYLARVIFEGPRIRVLFGNRLLFDAVDASMLSSGKAGVWSKGRTTASFDDFRIEKKG